MRVWGLGASCKVFRVSGVVLWAKWQKFYKGVYSLWIWLLLKVQVGVPLVLSRDIRALFRVLSLIT